jgi:putative DNA primase/helicase
MIWQLGAGQSHAAERIWDYLDKDGRLLDYVAPERKKLLPITYCAGPNSARGWRMKGFPAPRPLHGLQSLAQRPDAPVLLVEGGKTACTAAEVFENYVAVTWCGGAKAIDKADLTPLTGRTVILWPDADAEGEAAVIGRPPAHRTRRGIPESGHCDRRFQA